MERFAIKIDKKLKANLYKICRLCGIDNPDMVPIISDKQAEANENACIDVEAEMEMQQKISLLIGLSITKDDKMPQTMCCLCVDKINDFYEFREMCYATNAQTRKLLGLKNTKKPVSDIKPKIEVKEESIIPTLTLASNKNVIRKRKSEEVSLKEETSESTVLSKKKLRFSTSAEPNFKEEIPVLTKKKLRFTAMNEEPTPSPPMSVPPPAVSNKKLRLAAPSQKESVTKKSKQKAVKNTEQKEADVKEEIKEEIKEDLVSAAIPVPPVKVPPAPKLKFGCNICRERFPAKVNLEAHSRTTHIPKIERYVCTACNEVLTKSFDIKNHQLWHKLSKTPYVCGCCGESILNTYAFSRHLREHAFETPPALLVLDRECPQCHTTYATNFLYNTHICAVKTKRCAGCNRLMRNDAEYLKHSAQCAKVYLNYSKHIMPSVEALEDAVRIKNENDVEAAAEEMARISGVPIDMAPVVQLTRLSSPLIMAASQCVSLAGLDDAAGSSSKKSGKKGVSKKDLKRVDELLKSTLDALVSIKHEPEVHVDQETPSTGEHSDNEDHHVPDDHVDDFLNNDDSDKESEEANTPTKNDELGQEQIKIKQEIDETSEENSNKIGGGLKLKIKKEHGQLNSSIIEQQKSSEKRAEKRKKKKKHKDKEKDKQKLSKDMQDEQVSQDSNTNFYNSKMNVGTTTIRIKTEPQDGNEAAEKSLAPVLQIRPQPEATIMTSIPMMQFQIACVSSGVEFNNGTNAVIETHPTMPSANHGVETEDIKPNREELDRMLKISHVSGGIAMETDETEESKTQTMDHDKGNGGEDDYQEESNEDDHHVDYNMSECEEDSQSENAGDEQEDANDKIDDLENPSESTGIDNKEIIAKKIRKPLLKQKSKLVFKPKDKPLTTSTKSRNKACKSTAKPPQMPILQISAVQSGISLESSALSTNEFTPVFIKPEPQNRGYSDEPSADLDSLTHTPPEETSPPEETVELSHSHSAEEQNYISSIDFNNITIKQEKDIDIDDVQITEKSIKSFTKLNGIKRKRKQTIHRSDSFKDKKLDGEHEDNKNENMEDEEKHETDEETEEENDDDAEYGEETGEEMDEEDEEVEEEDEEEEEEEREYRELEYPPELVENKTEVETTDYNEKDNENNNQIPKDSVSNSAFVIANVCSQATNPTRLCDGNVDGRQNVLNYDNNFIAQQNVSDIGDNTIRSSTQALETNLYPADKNAEILNNATNKKSHDNRLSFNVGSSDGSDPPTADEQQTDLNTAITSFEKQAENTHSASIPLENNPPQSISLQLGQQAFQITADMQTADDIDPALQPSQRVYESMDFRRQQYMNEELESGKQQMPKNSLHCTGQDMPLNREIRSPDTQESLQNILQYSTAGDQYAQEQRNDSKDQQQKNLQTTFEHSQSISPVSLENISNIHDIEVQPQTSHLQPLSEISSTETTPLAEITGLKNNTLSSYDVHKTFKNTEDYATIEGVVQQPKDETLKAKPVTDFRSGSINEDDNDEDNTENEDGYELEENYNNNDELTLENNLEERQNYQNQEVLSHIRPAALTLHPYLEDISSSSNSLLSNSLSQTPPPPSLQLVAPTLCSDEFNRHSQGQQRVLNQEETENVLNESNDVPSRRSLTVAGTSAVALDQPVTLPHLSQQLPPHMPTFNFDNVNEIAENNNNANIEREQLQDGQQVQQPTTNTP